VKLLLDTSVLIDVLRGRKDRRRLLAHLLREGHSLSTTVLNIAELHAGMRPGEESSTEAFLADLECFEFNGSAARLAGQLKRVWQTRGKTLTLSDTIIAAIAIEHQCTLLTDNRKDFPMSDLSLFPLPK
jgi:predicted nucleic acid-binding protein